MEAQDHKKIESRSAALAQDHDSRAASDVAAEGDAEASSAKAEDEQVKTKAGKGQMDVRTEDAKVKAEPQERNLAQENAMKSGAVVLVQDGTADPASKKKEHSTGQESELSSGPTGAVIVVVCVASVAIVTGLGLVARRWWIRRQWISGKSAWRTEVKTRHLRQEPHVDSLSRTVPGETIHPPRNLRASTAHWESVEALLGPPAKGSQDKDQLCAIPSLED